MSTETKYLDVVPPVYAGATTEASFGGSRRLFRDAALEFGVDLSEKEYDDWRGLLAGACLVDHLLDVEEVEIVPHISRILDGHQRSDLQSSPQTAAREYWLRQTPESAQNILEKVKQVGELATAQRETSSAHTLVSIRLEEAEILTDLLSLDTRNSTTTIQRQRFNNWLLVWSRTGYLLDSFVDLKKDFENGESGVKPTLAARAIVGMAVSREASSALKETPSRLFGKCVMNGIRYILLNTKLQAT